jgi:hypothetical protein
MGKISERESTLTWSDCEYAHRKMSETQQRIMKYACGGFKKTGLNDDFMVICSMIELRDLLNKLLDARKKQTND